MSPDEPGADQAPSGSGDAGISPLSLPPGTGRRPATSLLTWGTVAIVLVIVIVLVVIKVTGSPTPSTSNGPPTPSPATPPVLHAITSIPASIYNKVGVTSTVATVTPPSPLQGQQPLIKSGKPEVLFVGDEFCPYCAAERWALVAALSRFGTFSVLDTSQSGSNEAFAGTPTFTFAGSRYSSDYIAVNLVERYGDQKDATGTAYALLEHLTPKEHELMANYDRATAAASGTAASGTAAPGTIVPFVDIGGEATVVGGSFSPSIFQQLSITQVANGLTDPQDPVTQAIVASANELSAVICQADGQVPTNVCASVGVSAAARALHLE